MKLTSRPRFSIVIPCYNEESYIRDTLTSLKKQTFSGTYEIIIVDNNSQDGTVKAAQYFDVSVIHEKKIGVCWARQTGTTAAKGEIVISTDADTIFSVDWLEKIDAVFKKDPACIAVAGPCIYRGGPWWGKGYTKLLFRIVDIYTRIFGHPFYITATNIAFRKSVWTGYDVHSPQGGDELNLLHKLRKQGKVAFCLNNPVYTSARRLKRGLVYNLFVTFLYYYLLGYALDRIFGRTVIGSAPAFRFFGGDENHIFGSKRKTESAQNKTNP